MEPLRGPPGIEERQRNPGFEPAEVFGAPGYSCESPRSTVWRCAMARVRLPALLLVVLASTPSPARADWIPNGNPVCTNGAQQSSPVIAPDDAGGAYVVWLDGRNSPPVGHPWGQVTDVYVQRMTASGEPAPGWPINGVPLCTAAGYQGTVGPIALTPDGFGGVIACWSDSRANPGSGDLYAQRITGAGTIAPGWPTDGVAVCAAPDWQDEHQLVPDGAGGAFAIWRDQRKGNASDQDTYAQHLTATGGIAPGWPADGLALDATSVTTVDCSLLEDGAGGAFFVYSRDSAGTGYHTHLMLKRLDGSGATAAGWPAEGVVMCRAPEARIHPRLVHDGAGGVIGVWADTRADASGDIYAAHVTAAAVVDPAWPLNGRALAVAPAYQGPPEVVSDGAGGAIAAWSDYRNNFAQIFAQHVTSAGTIAPGWPAGGLLACTTPAASRFGGIATDGMGGAYIAYMAGVGGIFAQHLTTWGTPAPGWPDSGVNLRTLRIGGYDDPRVAPTLAGGAIVTWQDERGPAPVPPFYYPNPYDIYATKIADDGPVPVMASLVSAELRGLTATIVWQLSGATNGPAAVERRVDEGGWSMIGEASAGGSERWRFEDATLAPGHTYGYRLGYSTEGGGAYAPEAVVVVPAMALEIGRVAAVRATGAVELSITLATDEPASLELFDVGGRRVASRDVGSLGAGVHAVRIEHPAVTSGLLFARLRQGLLSVTARALIVR